MMITYSLERVTYNTTCIWILETRENHKHTRDIHVSKSLPISRTREDIATINPPIISIDGGSVISRGGVEKTLDFVNTFVVADAV